VVISGGYSFGIQNAESLEAGRGGHLTTNGARRSVTRSEGRCELNIYNAAKSIASGGRRVIEAGRVDRSRNRKGRRRSESVPRPVFESFGF
jgi:hypothetical protein